MNPPFRFLRIAAPSMLILLLACGSGDPELPGTWVDANSKTKNPDLRFVFNETGTGKMRLGKDKTTNFTWEIEGKTMFIKSKSTRSGGRTTEKTEFTLNGDQLTLTFSGQILELKRR